MHHLRFMVIALGLLAGVACAIQGYDVPPKYHLFHNMNFNGSAIHYTPYHRGSNKPYLNGVESYTWEDSEGDMVQEYDGEWTQGLPHGHGEMTWADGDVYVGEFKGVNVPPGQSRLQPQGGCTSAPGGYGEYTWADGAVYDGKFKLRWRDLEYYYELKNEGVKNLSKAESHLAHVLEVKGKMTYTNGDVYDGKWEDGGPYGQGKMKFADGVEFVGNFKKDFTFHGDYKMTCRKCSGSGEVADTFCFMTTTLWTKYTGLNKIHCPDCDYPDSGGWIKFNESDEKIALPDSASASSESESSSASYSDEGWTNYGE